MELGDDPSPDEIVSFFTTYGFFLCHPYVEEKTYIRYSEDEIKGVISSIRNMVFLNNSVIQYSQRKIAGNPSIDFTAIGNSLMSLLFSSASICSDRTLSAQPDDKSSASRNRIASYNGQTQYSLGLGYNKDFGRI